MDILATVGVLIAVYVSFTISASAGLGGSLLMVPTLALFLGTKEGVALAALLLASNNIMKIIAYRETLPFRKAAGIAVLIVIGAAIGSTLLVNAPVWAVTIAVLAMFATTIITEKREIKAVRSKFGPFLAFVAGASSGFSGTSGPLKGVAIRNLDLDRRHFVGAASLASIAGDGQGGALRVGQGVWRDAEMVEQRAADKALDGRRLTLATESADEAGLEIGAAADAVAVGVGGIGP